ncbi:PEP-CTERM sorting domain-containing protein [Brumicola nitratireducens]|uniref:Ice-binding protein C-terminal domain-containing protein n=1 Tax=Glaciecola nitratireducens (strain JCM 12485 / KCTC 12276 / FR1064) TaxID=1085623 RepID=G4QHC9_GLANF|nr:PEP-CTERM sorting domain-containing protein [Glaciecola nitratireducens]AEP29760.1 hypothetical protein GNIT_1644 [Glaciecola nitratireducens FR1064]
MKFKMLKAAFAGLVLTVSGFANSAVILSGDVTAGSGVLKLTTDYRFEVTSAGIVRIMVFDEWAVTSGIRRLSILSGPFSLLVNGVDAGVAAAGMYDSFSFTSNDVSPADTYMYWNNNISVTIGDILTIKAGSWDLSAIAGWNTNVSGQFDGELFLTDDVGVKRTGNGVAVPEPSTLAILALSLIGLGARRFKKLV